jgi:hypothetical protein
VFDYLNGMCVEQKPECTDTNKDVTIATDLARVFYKASSDPYADCTVSNPSDLTDCDTNVDVPEETHCLVADLNTHTPTVWCELCNSATPLRIKYHGGCTSKATCEANNGDGFPTMMEKVSTNECVCIHEALVMRSDTNVVECIQKPTADDKCLLYVVGETPETDPDTCLLCD